MLNEGTMLSGRYEILGKIGAGGMADVYKGKDHKLNRFIAIKVLKREFHEDESFIQKFTSEAQAAGGLMHPNVVNVYDVGEDQGANYMVMELVEGITLKQYIQKKGRLSAKEAISITIQMANGIQAAHNKNIIHRDIKPQNVIISKEGKVKVTDFGIAKAANSNTMSSTVLGSVHYTSPEQARGAASDARSDIYSLGITMYEMVTGRLPFDGDTAVAVAVKHLQEEIISPAEYVPELPYSLEQIILKCTQKRPEFRYPDVASLVLDLKRSLVDPEGDFVRIRRVPGSDTVMLSERELQQIQLNNRSAGQYDGYDDDDYEEERYDDYDGEYDDDDDYDDDDYDQDDDYDEDDYGRGSSRKRNSDVNPRMNKLIKILMIVVAVLIAFFVIVMAGKAAGIFGSGLGFVTEDSKDKVKVPNVVGKTQQDAIAALNKVHLGYELVDGGESEKYEKDYVMEQGTKAGTKVSENTRIKIVVSSGKQKEEVTMPDVRGLDQDKAQKELEKLGLKVSVTYEYSSMYAEGEVISTTYEPGTKVAKGTEVGMQVSKGEEPVEKVEVPDITGKTEVDAIAALEATSLYAGDRKEEYSDEPAGTVISQDIAGGNKIEVGGSVGYTVSKGKEKAKMPEVIGFSEEAAKVRIQEAGLTPVIYHEVNEKPKGTVFYASANTGDELEKGATVEIWISDGPAVQPPTDGNNGNTNNNGGNTGGNTDGSTNGQEGEAEDN